MSDTNQERPLTQEQRNQKIWDIEGELGQINNAIKEGLDRSMGFEIAIQTLRKAQNEVNENVDILKGKYIDFEKQIAELNKPASGVSETPSLN